MKAMKETLKRIKIGPNHFLKEEIEFLKSMEKREELDPKQEQRAKRVTKECKNLMAHDWANEEKFSKQLKNKIFTKNNQLIFIVLVVDRKTNIKNIGEKGKYINRPKIA